MRWPCPLCVHLSTPTPSPLQSRWFHVAVVYNPATGIGSIFWDGNLKNEGPLPQAVVVDRARMLVGRSNSIDAGLPALGT